MTDEKKLPIVPSLWRQRNAITSVVTINKGGMTTDCERGCHVESPLSPHPWEPRVWHTIHSGDTMIRSEPPRARY